MFHSVVQVVPTKDYMVYVYFEDGKIVCYNVRPLLGKRVFEVLNDINVFMEKCTILNDTLAWDIEGDRDESKCIDIDSETLYELENVKEQMYT
jgi:hypothetical protein